MVAAVIDGESFALEHAQRIIENRRARFAARPGGASEAVLDARRKGDRRRLLARLQHVDGEMRRAGQRRGARRHLVQADEEQGRVERHGGEAVDRDPRRPLVLVEAGDDGHSGGEAAERVAQRAGVVTAAILALRRLHHAVGYSALDCNCEAR